ncbi:MAG: signal peptidase I, partial [Defluviitaleaceae bacterium]|nr:signal peptidase I [Defluviitaleaceae bacterium]
MSREVRSENINEVISWIKTILFAVILAVFINQVVIVNATVPTGSMEDTIMPNSRIVAFRLDYLFTTPKRFDIVVFRYPDDRTQLFVKRVIGLPGETVSIRDGEVYI